MLRLAFAALLAPLAAPRIEAPRVDETPARAGEWGFRPADGARVERTPPAFAWRPQKGAVAYELEIAAGAGFDDPVYRVEDVAFNVHCPPVALEPGAYRWRFRFRTMDGEVSGWSTTRAFEVPEGAAEFTLPARDELLARVPDAHPRLFVRPEELPTLRARLDGELAEPWRELLARCDRLLADPPPTDEPPKYPPGTKRGSDPWRAIWWGNRKATIAVLEAAADLAFVHHLGGGEEYGALAKRLLLDAAAWDPEGATGYRYNDEAGMPYAYHFSRAYTFLHDALSEAERERCRAVMRVRGREMHAHLSPRHLWKPYSSHSNRAWHFLGEVGIAFRGEIAEADDWIWFAANVFACVYPVWSDADGGWHEGFAYWRSYLSRFTWWADVMRAALGLDAYRLPFFSRAGDWALYLLPPGKQGAGFGDLCAPRASKDARQLLTVLAAQSGNPYWAWHVEQHGGPAFQPGFVGLLRRALPKVEPVAPAELPPSRLFRGVGQAVLNSTLLDAREDVQLVFKSSPFGSQSHGYEAQNAFLLSAFGERLLIRSGRRDSYGSDHHRNWMWETKSVNSLTVDGVGQRPHSASSRGEIVRFETSEHYDYVEGEAGASYAALESFRRCVLFVKPDFIVIVDQVVAHEPAIFTWHLHAPVPIEVTAVDSWGTRTDGVSCSISMLTPQGLEITTTDRFDPPPRPRVQLVEHHLTASTTVSRREALGLTVIRPFRPRPESDGIICLGDEDHWTLRRIPDDGRPREVVVGPGLAIEATVRDADGAVLARFER